MLKRLHRKNKIILDSAFMDLLKIEHLPFRGVHQNDFWYANYLT